MKQTADRLPSPGPEGQRSKNARSAGSASSVTVDLSAWLKTSVRQAASEQAEISDDVALAQAPLVNADIVHDKSLEAIEYAAKPGQVEEKRGNFDTYSMLGPLDYWVFNSEPENQSERLWL